MKKDLYFDSTIGRGYLNSLEISRLMYSKTRFNELLQLFPKALFDRKVKQLESDKYGKGFSSYQHLLAMIYGQLSDCKSLRELETSFNAYAPSHYHLGAREIRRSTLSDANRTRHCGIFESICRSLLNQAHRDIQSEAQTLLCLIDSSPIPLKGRGFEWANEHEAGRVKGLKLHVQYLSDYEMPCDIQISEANINDLLYGRSIDIESGCTYVFDKGYCDYNWWHKINEAGSVFVTRLKKNAGVKKITDRPIYAPNILCDEEIQFRHTRQRKNRTNAYLGKTLRRIEVYRDTHDTPLVLVTNDLTSSAQELATLYRRRWEIELWFKWIKQRLKIKRFLGRSANAVKIQIYVALITYLLLRQYRKISGTKKPFYLWFWEFKATLFESLHTRKVRRQIREQFNRSDPIWQACIPMENYPGQ